MSAPEAQAIYNTREWRRVSAQALERDGYQCRQCGRPARSAHHRPPIVELIRMGISPYDLDYIFSLCSACHGEEDGPRAHKPKAKKPNRFSNWLSATGG